MNEIRLSLIIPCYNEAQNLPLLLERCAVLNRHDGVEVILVDNGSNDDTHSILTELLPRMPRCRSVRVDKNRGYGHGIITGLNAAKGQILAWTHADLQTDPLDVLGGLRFFETQGHERIMIKGRRYGRPFGDVLFTIGMSIFETILLRCRLWDINAQPTMFRRSFFATWDNPPDDFSLDLYAYYLARVTGLKIHRFPVLFGERAHGRSRWNVDWASKKKFIERTIVYSVKLKKSIKLSGLR